ncbi:ArsR family transcriptional regulator [Sphingomonas psychrotolerans]|uniref:ArsR family transcriptional regulator n=1 Tax=Sphingomonas psychrotolerans TaxID=1327635 RepID=A0ABU3N6X8_9SPHN|nr:helix-turn-helix transcriptional regulator [Sphingomonas psychrotolerans]MDT8759527.1 ArsR family transcriptional regulator [Sphingomonas psychrotolerans]
MTTITSLASVAALIGDPTRTAMLVTLIDGRALTAGELAEAAGVAAPTASGHLGRLHEAGLLALERQGRHRYYRIASAEVAATLEGLMTLAGTLKAAARARPVRTGPRDLALRRARLCYDHLAGEVAVAIADAMTTRGQLDFAQDGGALTDKGIALLATLGIDAIAPRGRGATFCRPCLDWSERRPHIGGAVGRALYAAFEQNGWMRRAAAGRAVQITPRGATELHRHFGLPTAGDDDSRARR